MGDVSTLTVCGHDCSYCPAFGGSSNHICPGCNIAKGHPWWGVCKLYGCVDENDIAHCGVCPDFPCKLQVNHYDPDNPHGQRNAVIRTGILAYRARHGDHDALALLRKIKDIEK
ncbi:DUF3795 domain-containing protein [Candidatus Thorarchaeota archaeon]|nr:MAG: DUF3795 domain-containing protein [Candidatus Thorarchaeota archaeon]